MSSKVYKIQPIRTKAINFIISRSTFVYRHLPQNGGMYLETFPNATKSWRLKYLIGGKVEQAVMGIYNYTWEYFPIRDYTGIEGGSPC